MPIMRGLSGSRKTFKVPCSGEGIFVAANILKSSTGGGAVAYWNGTRMESLTYGNFVIGSITVQDGIATVVVSNDTGSYDASTRVCFIPGDPLASN